MRTWLTYIPLMKGMEFYMKGNKEKIYNIYHTLLSLGLTWAFILTINYYYELKIHMIICALCSITASVLIYLFDLYRRNAITYLILISSFPIMALFLWINKINTRNGLEIYFNGIRVMMLLLIYIMHPMLILLFYYSLGSRLIFIY